MPAARQHPYFQQLADFACMFYHAGKKRKSLEDSELLGTGRKNLLIKWKNASFVAKLSAMKTFVKHAYQRTRTGGLIFYSVKDCLVYFTLFCTISRKYPVKVYGLCLMPDHIHDLVEILRHCQLTSLIRESSSRYARAFNLSAGRTGQVFDKSFGSAIKIGGKKIRTAIAYLYNNPVEKKLCRKAEEYRWNFLAYRNNPNPFSPPIDRKTARKVFRRALAEVDASRKQDIPLSYAMLGRLMKDLNKVECNQLTDYIITAYNCIDYEGASEYFSGFDNMLMAIHSNTGSEYDINEITTKGDDKVYAQMANTLRALELPVRSKRVISLPLEEKLDLAETLYGYTQASQEQLDKFLWIGTKRITKRRHRKYVASNQLNVSALKQMPARRNVQAKAASD